MKVEEFDRLTKVPKLSPGRKKDKENPVQKVPDFSSAELQKLKRLRAVNRAPSKIQELYDKGLIALELAALLGPDEEASGYAERKAKADRAIAALGSIRRNGSASTYRKAVNDAVREVFSRKPPTPLENAQKAFEKLSSRERQQFDAWREKQS